MTKEKIKHVIKVKGGYDSQTNKDETIATRVNFYYENENVVDVQFIHEGSTDWAFVTIEEEK